MGYYTLLEEESNNRESEFGGFRSISVIDVATSPYHSHGSDAMAAGVNTKPL